VKRRLVDIYRTGDDFRRYTWDDANRRRELASFYEEHRSYFGRRVLDLGCGGGVLGRILEPAGLSYAGVDANPDMIREARKSAKQAGSRQTFMLGDIVRGRIPGRFDTITLLGNSMAHFDVRDMDELLRRRRANAHAGTTFLLEYRDLIAMFWQGTWSRVKIQTTVRGKVVHRARLVDLENGNLAMRARPSSGAWVLDWEHAIWSPFILEMLMRSHGWQLIRRSPPRPKTAAAAIPELNIDVYRLGRSRSAARGRPA
jgi:SAM-dependent methyltransferase